MDKDFQEKIKFISTALIAFIGWVFGHYFTSQRDKSNKRRDLPIQHLITTYRTLTLRADSRKQLNLEPIIGNVTWLRYGPEANNHK